MAAWKEAIAKAAGAPGDNASGLPALRQLLRAAAGQQPSAGAAASSLRDAAFSLDVVFESQGLGALVLQYAAAYDDGGSNGGNQVRRQTRTWYRSFMTNTGECCSSCKAVQWHRQKWQRHGVKKACWLLIFYTCRPQGLDLD